MDAREIKHMAQLEEWKERVKICRSSGMDVRAWCREQGISSTTYYHWEKEVLSEAGRQMCIQGRGMEKQFVEVPAMPEQIDTTGARPALAAKLRIKGGELEVYAGADRTVLETLLRGLKDVE